jgi:hypothetical protein
MPPQDLSGAGNFCCYFSNLSFRRQMRSVVALTASNPKIEGSGTGSKTSPKGPFNPEAKTLLVPSDENL